MIFLFTLIDYAAFSLWILISIALSYVLVQKLNFFRGKNLSQKILAIGLIAGHLLYLIWKKLWLYIVSFFERSAFKKGEKGFCNCLAKFVIQHQKQPFSKLFISWLNRS